MARTNYDLATRRHMVRMAELLSQEISVAEAGRQMGLTKGQTSNVWRNIKNEMGPQAA